MEDKEKKSYDPFGNDPINSIDFDISLDENMLPIMFRRVVLHFSDITSITSFALLAPDI